MRKGLYPIPFDQKKIPESSGVYFFCAADGTVLYVGKASNLRERLRAYALAAPGTKQYRLMREAAFLKIRKTASDIDALLEESDCIKRYQPKYNAALKDDKNYFFVCFVPLRRAPDFPRVWITHRPAAYQHAQCIGPFVDGAVLKRTLAMARSYFPFCTCKAPHERMCLNAHLGLCFGFCCAVRAKPTNAERRAYRHSIDSLMRILEGRNRSLALLLKRRIATCAKQEAYADAARLKRQLEGLERIFSHHSAFASASEESGAPFAASVAWLEQRAHIVPLRRIETIDTSMIQGKCRVAAITVYENGQFNPSRYRKFRIRSGDARDDARMMREALARRFAHTEWQYPDALFVDGGLAQFAVAQRIVHDLNAPILVCALTKGATHALVSITFQREKIRKTYRLAALPHDAQRLFLACSERTHAFAIRYYRSISGRIA